MHTENRNRQSTLSNNDHPFLANENLVLTYVRNMRSKTNNSTKRNSKINDITVGQKVKTSPVPNNETTAMT